MSLEPRVIVALLSAMGVALLVAAALRWRTRGRVRSRLRALGMDRDQAAARRVRQSISARAAVSRVGASIASRLPRQLEGLRARVDRAGLSGRTTSFELLGWKALGVSVGAALGLLATIQLGTAGFLLLIAGMVMGWFGVDFALERYHSWRRRQILRDLPTVMDLLVLSLEAGMGLDRALRTVISEYRSALADEFQRVLNDIDLGVGRGEAFERMAARVGLDDLRALSRSIVQSEELGVSLVGVMQTQSHEVRLSRRRAAEAEALRAPIKMLIPLVLFILPTLFMLLLGPVFLRAGMALSGSP